jgi:regulator of sigma E protease
MGLLLNFWFLFIALLALGVSIFVHELGHYLAAVRRGLKVERFSIGFGPRLFGWTRNGVDYRISLIPLGGYVALPQLADMGRLEGDEGAGADAPLPPISYADKMIVAVMGAVFNLIFAFLLSLLLWGMGQEVPVSAETTRIGHVAESVVDSEGQRVPGPAWEAGLRKGDLVREVDGRPVDDWMGMSYAIITGFGKSAGDLREVVLTVERDGGVFKVAVNPVLATVEAIREIGISPSSQLYVGELQEGMPAVEAGLEEGDRLLALDGEPILSFGFLQEYLATHGDGPIDVKVLRGDEILVVPVAPVVAEGENRPRFGFAVGHDTQVVHRDPVEQLGAMLTMIRDTAVGLFHPDSDVKARNMSGPVGIVHGLKLYAELGFVWVLWFLAFINVNLAIFNLMPIPVLDGGHMMFATVSKLSGRQLPRRFMEAVQFAFIILLLGFVAYVSFYDVRRVFGPDPAAEEAPAVDQPGTAEDGSDSAD